MIEEIPQWALDRAANVACYDSWSGLCNLCSDDSGIRRIVYMLARYIAQHEQPPIDPDLVKAREICARVAEEVAADRPEFQAHYRDGTYDEDTDVQFVLSTLKEIRNSK